MTLGQFEAIFSMEFLPTLSCNVYEKETIFNKYASMSISRLNSWSWILIGAKAEIYLKACAVQSCSSPQLFHHRLLPPASMPLVSYGWTITL